MRCIIIAIVAFLLSEQKTSEITVIFNLLKAAGRQLTTRAIERI